MYVLENLHNLVILPHKRKKLSLALMFYLPSLKVNLEKEKTEKVNINNLVNTMFLTLKRNALVRLSLKYSPEKHKFIVIRCQYIYLTLDRRETIKS